MPSVGLGTYRVRGSDIENVLRDAIHVGYRHIDTAAVYRNEKNIGQVLREYIGKEVNGKVLKRADFFITSKLAPKDHGFENAYAALQTSLKNLELDYLDLFLIHWPGKQGLKPSNPENLKWRQVSWRALEKASNEGLVRAIGVSNYTIKHLEQLLEMCTIRPSVNQLEFHPMLSPERIDSLLKFHREQNIVLEAYSSLAEGQLLRPTDNHIIPSEKGEGPVSSKAADVLVEYAQSLSLESGNKPTLAQVALAWAWSQGVPVIPKTTSLERAKENLEMLKFVEPKKEGEESKRLTESIARKVTLDVAKALNGTEVRVCWNPETVT